jgi:hypothetical protein
MRLPKTVRINNRPWKVIKTPKSSSGNFSYKNMTIKIGTQGNSQREILGGFIHEIAEISDVERGVRCTKNALQHEANDFRFAASHTEFAHITDDISSIIGDIMKLK